MVQYTGCSGASTNRTQRDPRATKHSHQAQSDLPISAAKPQVLIDAPQAYLQQLDWSRTNPPTGSSRAFTVRAEVQVQQIPWFGQIRPLLSRFRHRTVRQSRQLSEQSAHRTARWAVWCRQGTTFGHSPPSMRTAERSPNPRSGIPAEMSSSALIAPSSLGEHAVSHY